MFCSSYLLCNVSLFWEVEQRCLQLFIAGEGAQCLQPGGAQGCLAEGDVGSLPSEMVGFSAFLCLFPFISIAGLMLNKI